MSTVRLLLECLGQESLGRLLRDRGLTAGRKSEDRRRRLTRSYRGDVEAFVHDLQRTDLVSIFRQVAVDLDGEEWSLRSPGRYRLDELRAFALQAFSGSPRYIASDLRSKVMYDDDGAGADEELDEEGSAEWDTSAGDADADFKEDGSANATEARGSLGLSRNLTETWSRPRKLSRVMQMLDMTPPKRLRTTRFQEILTALRAHGIEACLADDPLYALLSDDAKSPGMRAKLRLRLMTAHGTTSVPAPRHSSPRTREHVGPTIVIQEGEQPVSQRVVRPSDYELAMLRLRFLTAVPSVERGSMPAWPSAYLTAATRGLELRPEEISLLGVCAKSMCMGNHSPYESIPRLPQVSNPSEWERLLEDFVALNPFQPDVVNAIIEQVAPFAASRSEAPALRPAVTIAEDFREPPPAPEVRAQEPLAASGQRGTSVATSKAASTNIRDMGVLAGLFGDE